MEGLKECEANLVVHLHPSQAGSANESILRELSSLLFTYNETFDGVVLAYDPNIRSNLAKILPGLHPYFGVKLKAKLLLFNPKPDMLLEGKVVRITPHSIHAVVLGFCAAFIADEDIRVDFKHKFKREKQVFVSRANKKHKITVGTILRFTVKSFDEEVLHVIGSLAADSTGSAQWLDKNFHEWSEANSTAKSEKGKEGKDENPENFGLMLKRETSSFNNDDNVKRVKKRRKDHS